MPKTFHNLKIRVICNATENEDLLVETMKELCGEGDIEITEGEGHYGNRIFVLEAELRSLKEHDRLFKTLGSDAVLSVINELEARMDDDGTLYLRFDKQAAVQGEWKPARHGDVFAISGKVETHPVNRTEAMLKAKTYLRSFTE